MVRFGYERKLKQEEEQKDKDNLSTSRGCSMSMITSVSNQKLQLVHIEV